MVEVILALALTTLLLGLLSSGVFIVAGDWNRNASLLDASLDEALIILQIDRALHGAFPHSFTNEETLSRQLFFAGESDYLAWVSTVSPQRAPGLTAWELFNVEDEGVYLTLVPAFSDDPSLRLQEAEPILIYPDHSVSFSYLYEDLGENRVWNSEWNGEELLSLPLAVYARFEPEMAVRGMSPPRCWRSSHAFAITYIVVFSRTRRGRAPYDNKHAQNAKSQKGSVLIIVLWTSVLLTVLVTAMAGKVRLAAQTVAQNQHVSTHWAAVMGSVHQAEMELMLEMMAPPIDQEVKLTEEGEKTRAIALTVNLWHCTTSG